MQRRCQRIALLPAQRIPQGRVIELQVYGQEDG
ncbi:hypothetical protein H650_21575 [Enterobacter sp. R4-368]|nr:hypothetical protein H650_21575 [Enterobacter sp. R4-368]